MKLNESKYSEEEFIKLVYKRFKNTVKIVGRYKGLTKPLLIEDKFGLILLNMAKSLLIAKPGIKSALNKTQYFIQMLKEKYPSFVEKLIPESEYISAKEPMLFKTQYGIVKISPDALLAGHFPTIKSAINRKDYFKNQLLFLYDNKYDFKITSTDRHKGTVTLICPIHGEQIIDSDGIFLGRGCPKCNNFINKSNIFYLILLYNQSETFYKIGISYKTNSGELRKFSDYKKIGYSVLVIKIIEFDTPIQAKEFELSIKRLIKPNLYTPNNWLNKTSTECFRSDLLSIVLDKIKYDIVSTSTEMLSSQNDGHKLTTYVEDNGV